MGEQRKQCPFTCGNIILLMRMPTAQEHLRYPTSFPNLVIIISSFVSVLKTNCTVTFHTPLRYGTYFDIQTHHHSKFYSLDIFLFENQILHSHYCTQTDRLYHKTQLHSLNIQVFFRLLVKAILGT